MLRLWATFLPLLWSSDATDVDTPKRTKSRGLRRGIFKSEFEELERKKGNVQGGGVDSSMIHTRVIGGVAVDPSQDRYPYMALMWGDKVCGGVLISPTIVLSAAHCYDAAEFVRVGIHSREQLWANNYDVIPIAQKIIHPNYSFDRYDHDLMIMKLAEPSDKAYIRLNAHDDIPNGSSSSSSSSSTLSIMGFGDADPSAAQSMPTTLQVADVQYVPTSVCFESYRSFVPITDDMLCAARSGKDSCGGDSGGPLILQGNSTRYDLLVGTVAWGVGCAEARYPGVYSRMSFFYDWIVEQVCALSSSSSSSSSSGEIPDYMSCPTPSPTVSSAPSVSPAPSLSMSPSSPPSDSAAPSSAPSYEFINTLRFVGWTVPEGGPLLKHCQGDCDTDADCEEGLICFYRCDGEDVPGCLRGTTTSLMMTGAAALISDICIHPWDVR